MSRSPSSPPLMTDGLDGWEHCLRSNKGSMGSKTPSKAPPWSPVNPIGLPSVSKGFSQLYSYRSSLRDVLPSNLSNSLYTSGITFSLASL